MSGTAAASPGELLERIEDEIHARRPAVFLDYDGTLTPIVERPDDAVLAPATRAVLRRLAGALPVVVVSGRDREDVAARVGLPDLVYAGSHGLDIAGPAGPAGSEGAAGPVGAAGAGLRHEMGAAAEPALRAAEAELTRALDAVPGAEIEPKRFTVAVHYRRVPEDRVEDVARVVDGALAAHPELVKAHGKKVFEIRPRIEWDKGRAVVWLLEELLAGAGQAAVYIGDDVTDEDAFRALAGWAAAGEERRAVGVLVAAEPRPTAARHRLRGPDEVRELLALAARRWG